MQIFIRKAVELRIQCTDILSTDNKHTNDGPTLGLVDGLAEGPAVKPGVCSEEEEHISVIFETVKQRQQNKSKGQTHIS